LVQEEINMRVPQALQNTKKLRERSAEPIDRPGSHHVEFFGVRRLEQGIEAGTFVASLGSADTGVLIDLDDLPARALGHRLQFAALIAGFLLRSADSEIDRDTFHDALPSFLPIVGRGSVQSVADILFLKGVDLGIVRADTLDYLEKKAFANDIKKRFTYVTKLYNEEMQVIAPKSIKSLNDLEGKTVSVDLPNGGTFVTALTVFERLGIKAKFVYVEQRIAMEKLKNGELDAVIVVGGKPYLSVTTFNNDGRFHLATVDYSKPYRAITCQQP
jgi:hypothetical protein